MYQTKFRAFQLATDGSLFSYYKQNQYTLIEARLPKGGIEVLQQDLDYHGKTTIDTLHITSWDEDHCHFEELTQIINHFRPNRIEVPHYQPDSNNSKLCYETLMRYDHIHQRRVHNVQVIDRAYLNSLTPGKPGEINNIVYESMFNCDCKNDMSLIELFRSAGFNVLSLGDCESADTAKRLMDSEIIRRDVDVLILPHHGADNGFISPEFLRRVNPKLAICSSNHGNQYDHPKEEIRKMLYEANIPLYTTKTGDVFIYKTTDNPNARAVNFNADNNGVSSEHYFTPKPKAMAFSY